MTSGAPAALEKFRALCLALPDTSETLAWGHPNFKVHQKTFAVFEKYQGEWAIVFKTDLAHQRQLVDGDPRFYVSPYVGKQGWVSMKLTGRLNWKKIERWVRDSHQRVEKKVGKKLGG